MSDGVIGSCGNEGKGGVDGKLFKEGSWKGQTQAPLQGIMG